MRPALIYFCITLTGVVIGTTAMAAERAAPVTEAGSSAAIQQRLDNIERMLQNQGLLDMLQQLQALQREVADLRGQVELNNHEIEKLKEQQRQLYSDIDKRLQSGAPQIPPATEPPVSPPLDEMAPAENVTPAGPQADSALSVENVTPPAPETAPDTAAVAESTEIPAAPAEPAAPVNPLEAQAQYQAAFTLLKQADYDQAITAFDRFLGQYPDSQYAENAQYWMAEALYVKRRFNEAITEYMKLVSTYPQSQRVPHSLLKIGYSYFELNQPEDAKKVLQDLIQKYPGTTAASDAETRLKRSSAS